MKNPIFLSLVLILFLSPPSSAEMVQSVRPAAPVQPTSISDVVLANPIKLSISKSDLITSPILSGQLSLEGAIQSALKSNPLLAESQETWLSSKFQSRSALARFGPSASLSGFFAQSSVDQMLFFMPDQLAAPPMQPITQGTSFHGVLFGYQPLFTGGRLLGGLRLARAQERQTQFGFAAEKLSTALKVKQFYWEAAYDIEKARLASDYVKYRQWSTINLKAKYEQGKIAKADVLREEAELSKAKMQLNEAYRQYNSALIKLKTLMAISVTSEVVLADKLDYSNLPHELDFYVEQAATTRPELSQSQAVAGEAAARRQVSLSKYAPQVNLYGLGSNANGRTSGVDGNAQGRWGGFVGIVGGITLFDSGERLNQVRSANAGVRKARLMIKDAELKVLQEVSLAWVDLDTARRNVELRNAELVSSQEDQRLIHARYEVGKAVALEDFLAGVKAFEARQNQIESIYQYRVAEAQLIAASGGI